VSIDAPEQADIVAEIKKAGIVRIENFILGAVVMTVLLPFGLVFDAQASLYWHVLCASS